MSRRNKDKGRISGQWTALRWEVLDSAAWKQMSMGARLLYIALIRPLSYYNDNNGRIFLSTRRAADELGASQRSICIWFRELAHYGFIAQTDPGNAMRAARWRITDVGWGKLDGKPLEATKDYLKWDGALFEYPDTRQLAQSKNRFGRVSSIIAVSKQLTQRGEEAAYSRHSASEEAAYSEGQSLGEEASYSDLVQPSPALKARSPLDSATTSAPTIPNDGTAIGTVPHRECRIWSTPIIVEEVFGEEAERLRTAARNGVVVNGKRKNGHGKHTLRAEWLATTKTKGGKPWEADGISRRTWYRRRAGLAVASRRRSS
jgi:hypothetical protein